ncbi:aminopyruvatide family RiPP [Rhizobium ruizarguesonis]|uniref:aminopyruvatide family RiPP n=1 Tax=Rhizobium ruizarguesonis TaxID=2081791 RepID=UPI0013EEB1F2|nr:hypothetical protein [Rhizobium ruizarguesonis]
MATKKEGKKSSIELSFELNDEQTKQIQECIRKGTLKIQVLDIEDIKDGRAASAYLYD